MLKAREEMPVYEYVCNKCGEKFDRLVRASADQDAECPECHSRDVRKVFSVFGMANPGGQRSAALTNSCAPSGGG